MALIERVTTTPTFHEGKLYDSGSLIVIDTDLIELREDEGTPGTDGFKPGNSSNLAPLGTFPISAAPISTVDQVLGSEEISAMQDQISKLTAMVGQLTGTANPADGEVIEEGAASALTFDASTIIAGTIDEVKTALVGLTKDQLSAVKVAEEAAGNRAGAVAAIDAAIAAA